MTTTGVGISGRQYGCIQNMAGPLYICGVEKSMQRENYSLAVFDSDRAMLDACTLILKEHGIAIQAFSNSTDIVNQLQAHPPSAILLDNSILPHGGLEVLQLLQQHRELKEIPVIYMTANGVTGDKALRYGAEFLLIKPFDLPQLVETVLRACRPGTGS